MAYVVALLWISLSCGMTDAYVAHRSVQYSFTSHCGRRLTSFFRVALSRCPHSQFSSYPVSRSGAFQIQSFWRFF
jgi:hypothetical protein